MEQGSVPGGCYGTGRLDSQCPVQGACVRALALLFLPWLPEKPSLPGQRDPGTLPYSLIELSLGMPRAPAGHDHNGEIRCRFVPFLLLPNCVMLGRSLN